MGDTPAGNASRVINALKEFQKLADKDKEHLDKVVTEKWGPKPYTITQSFLFKSIGGLRKRGRIHGRIAMRAESSRISNECACYRPARRWFFCDPFLPHANLYN